MNNKKIQSITRISGIFCLVLVAAAQLFKNQAFISQAYVPYLTIASLVLLIISLYLKVKSSTFSYRHLPIKFVLIFVGIVVLGIVLINYFTTL